MKTFAEDGKFSSLRMNVRIVIFYVRHEKLHIKHACQHFYYLKFGFVLNFKSLARVPPPRFHSKLLLKRVLWLSHFAEQLFRGLLGWAREEVQDGRWFKQETVTYWQELDEKRERRWRQMDVKRDVSNMWDCRHLFDCVCGQEWEE